MSTSTSRTAAPPSVAMGAVTVVLTLVGWSSVPLFLRHFSESIDFWTSNGWRYGFSALLWLPVLVIVAARRRLPRGLWRAALAPSVVNAAGQVCFTWAHYRIDPAMLTFGLRCQLIFVAAGAWMLFPKERAIIRTPGYLAGAALLIIGMVGVMALDGSASSPLSGREGREVGHASDSAEMNPHTALPLAPLEGASGEGVVSNNTKTHSQVPSPMSPRVGEGEGGGSAAGLNDHGVVRGTSAARVEGALLAIASGLLFACYGLSVRKFMEGVNSVIAFAAICQYTALILVVLMLLFGARLGATALDLSAGEIAKLLLSAVIGIAVGHVFYYLSIARLGVAVTAGVLQLQPFLVAVGSIALFGEVLSGGQWAGGVVAVAGAMLMLGVQYLRARREARIEDPIAIAEGESGG